MRLRRNGESNPATYVILVLLAGAAFYGYHVGPVYIDNMTVKKYCEEAVNQFWIEGEAATMDRLYFKLNHMPDTHHLELDDNGAEVEKPGLGITEEMVKLSFDENTKKLTVRIEYDRWIVFKPLKNKKRFRCVAEKSGLKK